MERTGNDPNHSITKRSVHALERMSRFDNDNLAGRNPFAPLFGTLCFSIGAAVLFLVSFGQWRVRRWPTFANKPPTPLEPTRVRIEGRSYFCADIAIFVGFILLLIAGFVTGMFLTGG